MHKAVDMILEAWEVKQSAKPQGQSIWQSAKPRKTTSTK